MRTAILIISEIDKKADVCQQVSDLKERIVEYVGTRLLIETEPEMPGVALNCTLTMDDKKAIDDMCEKGQKCVFIEGTEKAFDNNDMIDCELRD